MFLVDQVILFGGLLIFLAIVLRKVSARFGIPVLVLFLLVGMLAGSEGIGQIHFDDYALAHAVGTLALVIILFDGGLRTQTHMLRAGWKPALVLATSGVLLTALITGVAATWILGATILQGLLLGSIVASTDAAAVFSLLRSQGVHLNEPLQATLEVESGSNDPMAVFLTVGLIQVLLEERTLGAGLITFFIMQMGIGLLVGYLVGRAATRVINAINLDAAGLYPVLVATIGLLSFGLAAFVGGSGFLAVYVTGMVIGNSRIVFHRGTLLFHDGLAWIAQIVMFVLLGLLSFPSALIDIFWEGLGIAAVLTLIARPLAVVVSLLPFRFFRFSAREILLTSWVGLKGSVPIILATYPLLFGLQNGEAFFNVVFFVVLISVLIQGWSLPSVARMLGLQQPAKPEPPATLVISSLRHVNADIVDYEVTEDSAVARLRVSELKLPEDTVIAMITRAKEIIPARGPTVLLPGDHLFIIQPPEARPALDAIFSPDESAEQPLRAGIFMRGSDTLKDLHDMYAIGLDGDYDERIDQFMRRKLGRPLTEGAFLEIHDTRLYVHAADGHEACIIGIEHVV